MPRVTEIEDSCCELADGGVFGIDRWHNVKRRTSGIKQITATMQFIMKKLHDWTISLEKVVGMMMDGKTVPNTTPNSRPVIKKDCHPQQQ
uniref:Uncharacterized protein n=1 Tax=Caenorhabditis japonica TaxID=281687 RepID=A0A8R1ICC3_CAEJA